MKPERQKKILKLTAFALAGFLLIVAVFKYEGAGVAAVAGAFALIAQILGAF